MDRRIPAAHRIFPMHGDGRKITLLYSQRSPIDNSRERIGAVLVRPYDYFPFRLMG